MEGERALRKFIIWLVTAAVFIMTVLPAASFAAEDNAGSITRISGSDRVATSLAVCAQGWSQANTVVLAPANQENLADALLAVSLAGQEAAPILLMDKYSADERVAGRIAGLKAKKVYAVGALSDNALNGLKEQFSKAGKNIEVIVLRGNTRLETMEKIRARLTQPAGTFIVGFNSLADSLTASPYAYKHNYSFQLTQPDGNLPDGLKITGPRYILGGPNAVNELPGVERFAGTDRFGTNREFWKNFEHESEIIYIANGSDQHLVDSLVGAALAGKNGSAIYLTDQNGNGLSALVKAKIAEGSSVVLLGGTNALTEEAKKKIAGITDGEDSAPETGSPEVKTVKSLNLLQVAVEFNALVSRESAEDVTNYIVNGKTLTAADATAELQDDGRTVIITWGQTQPQNSFLTVEVKNERVFSAGRNYAARGYYSALNVQDTVLPALDGVKALGKKLTVRFSEAIELTDLAAAYKKWLLDGQDINSYGLSHINLLQGVSSGGKTFASGVEFFFTVPLTPGSHTLEVSPEVAGDSSAGLSSTLFTDGAGYTFGKTVANFEAVVLSGSPKVEVDRSVGTTVYLEFDRSMSSSPLGSAAANNSDAASALNVNNYLLNNAQGSITEAVFVPGTDNKQVRLTVGSKGMQEGLNLLTVNKNIEDVYGNRLVKVEEAEDLRLTFTAPYDGVKPGVAQVEVVEPNRIRIKFTEKINGMYALNKANYQVKDAESLQVEVTKITAVPDPDMLMYLGSYSSTDIYEIETAVRIAPQGFTLTIKNIQDMAINPNITESLDFNLKGMDANSPRIQEVLGTQSTNKAVVFFSEAMNRESLLNLANYSFEDGNIPSTIKPLPSGTKVMAGPENRSAVLTFPNAYLIDAAGSGIAGHEARYEVTAVQVRNVRDEKGQALEGGSRLVDIITPEESAYKVKYVADSLLVKDDGDDFLRVEFRLDQALEILSYEDFLVGTASQKLAADSGRAEGRTVILNFTAPEKVEAIRALGGNLMLFQAENTQSANIAGVSLAAFPAEGYQVYDDQVKPRVLSWSLEETGVEQGDGGDAGDGGDGGDGGDAGDAGSAATGDDYVVVTFSEAVDSTVLGLYADDFTFYYGGTDLKVLGVRLYVDAEGNTVPHMLVYDLVDGDYAQEGLNVRMNEAKISIRDWPDRKGDYNLCLFIDRFLF
jgi:putative cell wall-binding protein